MIDSDTDAIPTGIDTSIDTLGMDANPADTARGPIGEVGKEAIRRGEEGGY